MKNNKKIIGILSIIFGILVILKPSLLAWIVGIYLIIVGAMNLMN